MIKNKTLLLIVIMFHLSIFVFAQESKVEIPGFDDKYSNYVKQLENGDLNIDYADFRNSFLDSRQFHKKGSNYRELQNQLNSELDKNDYQEAMKVAQSLLSIDYTSMFAHYNLHHIYGKLRDLQNQKKHQDIEIGLLNSIIGSGDGKTCETGWHVTQIEEEYYVLGLIGARLQVQSIVKAGKNSCDKMFVKTKDGELTCYFEANKVFEMERKLLGE